MNVNTDIISVMRAITLSGEEKRKEILKLIIQIKELMSKGKLQLPELAKIRADLWWLQAPYTFHAMDGNPSPFKEIHALWEEVGKINGIEDVEIVNLREIEEITKLELLSLNKTTAMEKVPELLVQIESILDEEGSLSYMDSILLVRSLVEARSYFVPRRMHEQIRSWNSTMREELLETINRIDKIVDRVIEGVP